MATLSLLNLYTVVSEKIPFTEKAPRTFSEVHLSAGIAIVELGKLIDRVIVFSLLGASSLATYLIALLPVREMIRMPALLSNLVQPRLARYNLNDIKKDVFIKLILAFIFFSTVTAFYIISAPFLFSKIFPLYPEAIFYTQLLALLIPLSSSFLLVQVLAMFDKTKELYISNIVFTICNMILLGGLTYFWGIIGTIVAKLISTSVRFSLLIWLFKKIG